MNHSTTHTAVEKSTQKKPSLGGKLLTQFLSFATAITIVFCLLGYGVALAAESVFGIPHSSLFTSTFDLLDLSSIALLSFMDGGLDFLNASWSSILHLYVGSWRVLVTGIGAWLVLFCVLFFLQIKKLWLFAESKDKQKPSPPMSMTKRNILVNIFVIFAIALQPIITFLMASILILSTGLVAIAPLMGFSGGKFYIQKWVLDPEQCAPRLSERQQSDGSPNDEKKAKKKSTVLCLSILDKDKELASGRLVFATSSAVILFNPHTASAKRVPIDGMVIEGIPEIPR